ncbi:hypothetical protein ANN_00117 [Periplaneta americana]|uniref:Phosphagen kinase N-terminal domain-containing protein n=1 Tax=Periplaneta americana TaxID=6978 RepID=A0ABQ8TS93_PERAM|nr:hypothetical protein ANN_00117 [Periplaneta americana]
MAVILTSFRFAFLKWCSTITASRKYGKTLDDWCKGFSEETMVDAAVLEKLEAGFAKLAASDSKSLLKKYLTKEVFDNLKTKKTPSFGSTLLDVIQSGHVARMGESRNAYRMLVGWPEGKRPLGRQRRRWEDNIKMDLREVGYDDRDWINLAQDRDQW